MKLERLLEEHAVRQQKYLEQPLPWKELDIEKRQLFIRAITSYIMEELNEVYDEHLANDKEKLKYEIADYFIYALGLAAVSGLKDEIAEELFNDKLYIRKENKLC